MHDTVVDKIVQDDCTSLQCKEDGCIGISAAPHGNNQRKQFKVLDGMMIPVDAQASELKDGESLDQRCITEGERQGLGPRDPGRQTASSGNYIYCMHCERDDVPESLFQIGMCVDCYVEMSNRNTRLMRWGNADWKQEAEQAGVELYEQQPAESASDYLKFCCYRDMYPSTRPTLKDVAKQLNLSYNSVSSVANRWHWRERLAEWIRECDRITLEQRRQEMIDMNKRHIELAGLVDAKVRSALAQMDPATMKPSELNQLLKTMTQLERESRIDTIAQEELRADITHGGDNPELKKSPTKQEDFAEILSVLKQAGILEASDIGFKKTDKDGSTEELVVRSTKEVTVNEE